MSVFVCLMFCLCVCIYAYFVCKRVTTKKLWLFMYSVVKKQFFYLFQFTKISFFCATKRETEKRVQSP